MASPKSAEKKGHKVTVVLESKELRDRIDDEVYRGIREGKFPEGYSRSDWINDAIKQKLPRK